MQQSAGSCRLFHQDKFNFHILQEMFSLVRECCKIFISFVKPCLIILHLSLQEIFRFSTKAITPYDKYDTLRIGLVRWDPILSPDAQRSSQIQDLLPNSSSSFIFYNGHNKVKCYKMIIQFMSNVGSSKALETVNEHVHQQNVY